MTTVLGKYRLDALIAKGGMAEIFRGTIVGEAGFSKQVCIKRVRTEFCDEPEFAQMFEREANIAASLHHPNIVQVFDYDKNDGRFFIVMEYVDGLDLRHVLNEKESLGFDLPIGFSLHVVEGLLSALLAANELIVDGVAKPVVHRDVSPHNIMISNDGFVKLADFGIAKTHGASNATRTGVIKGKLAYLSPEQANGEFVGHQSDLFCAGLVMWEMLAGRRLNIGKTEQEILAKVLNPVVPRLPWLSNNINDFVFKLLAPNPANRFDNAAVALDELKNIERLPFSNSDAGRLVKGLMITSAQIGSTGISSPIAPSIEKEQSSNSKKITLNEEFMNAPTNVSKHDFSVAVKNGLFDNHKMGLMIAVVVLLVMSGLGTVAFLLVKNMDNNFNTQLEIEKFTSAHANIDKGVIVDSDIVDSDNYNESNSTVNKIVEFAKDSVQHKIEDKKKTDVFETLEKTDEKNLVHKKQMKENQSDNAQKETDKFITNDQKHNKSGFLQINFRPWAQVYLDGKLIGTTPIKKRKLSIGNHKITLKNKELEFEKNIKVKIVRGKLYKINEKIPIKI